VEKAEKAKEPVQAIGKYVFECSHVNMSMVDPGHELITILWQRVRAEMDTKKIDTTYKLDVGHF
jgi:hypothetical protein